MKNRISLKFTLALFMAFVSASGAFSQFDNTLFWLRAVPQSTNSNPAFLPNSTFHIGLPVVSSIYSGFNNSSFSIGDFYQKDNGGSPWDEANLLSLLSAENYSDLQLKVGVLDFGFKIGDGYLGFDISENIYSRFSYTKDLMYLFFEGPDYFFDNEFVPNFVGSEFDMLHYREYGLRYSRQFGHKLSLGFKLKAIQGLGKVGFKSNHIILNEDPVTGNVLVNVNLELNAAFPFKLGPFSDFGSDFDDKFDPVEYFTGFRNIGGAIDLGIAYKPMQSMSLGLSVTNLGFINWTQGVENFRMLGETDFEGFEMDDVFGDQEGDDRSPFEKIVDALDEAFDVIETTKTPRQNLPTRFYASAGYHIAKIATIGVLSRAELIAGQLYPSFTFSFNFTPFNALGLAASYSIIDKTPNNIGFGFNLNLGPVQVYAVSDNVLGALDPLSIKSFNARLGLNLVFGNRLKKKKEFTPVPNEELYPGFM